MKTFAIGLMAAMALGTALPAAAHDHDDRGNRSDWNDNASDGPFAEDVAHTREGIDHGLRDGTYSRWDAQRYGRELRDIEYQIADSRGGYGGFEPWERQRIAQRLQRLHQIMHIVHDERHDRQGYNANNWGNRGYGDQGDYDRRSRDYYGQRR